MARGQAPLDVGVPVPLGVGRSRVRLDVNGLKVSAIIDSGSTYTLLSKAVYHRLPRLTPLGAVPRLLSITGHELSTLGMCYVRLGAQTAQVIVCSDVEVDL